MREIQTMRTTIRERRLREKESEGERERPPVEAQTDRR